MQNIQDDLNTLYPPKSRKESSLKQIRQRQKDFNETALAFLVMPIYILVLFILFYQLADTIIKVMK